MTVDVREIGAQVEKESGLLYQIRSELGKVIVGQATLVDRLMNGMGLNGRAVIPVILGFGCVQLGTITTRILGSQRERTTDSC